MKGSSDLNIFTNKYIPQYTLIWDFNQANINIYNEKCAKMLLSQLESNSSITDYLKYTYITNDNLFIDIHEDPGCFFNHSNNPNVALGSVLLEQNIANNNFHPNSTYALYNIQPGTELLDDYNTYGNEPDWYKEIINRYGLDFSFMCK